MKAFITGASRGIGKAIAYEFAKNKYDLILTCKNNIASLNQIKEELSSYNISIEVYLLDFENTVDLKEKLSLIDLSDVDVLINNAGISYIELFNTMNYSDMEKMLNVNLYAPIILTREVVPYMIKRQNGKIINISSVWGEVGASMEVMYSTAKGGINAFTKSLAKELAPSNIKVNAISCGLIDTDMNACFEEDELNNLKDEIPMGRMGGTMEIAKICSFLSSENYITGQIIRADGGWL